LSVAPSNPPAFFFVNLPMKSPTRALVANLLGLAALRTAALGADSAPPTGNADHGKILFQQSCGVCHSTGQDARPASGQGPLLAGVMNRRAASLANFGYTRALQESHLTWTAATLDQFLAGPGILVPGTTMPVPVPGAADRSDLIAFLATLRPVALPAKSESAASSSHARTPGDWQNDAPGARHRIQLENLPAPFATSSAGNSPHVSKRPDGANLSVPAGFQVKPFLSGLPGPRLLRAAPNGDIFIAETGKGRIRVLRAADGADTPTENQVFADDLKGPFGIAFYPLGENPQWLYVANINSVVRYPYRNGDLQPRGPAEIVVPHLSDSTGGHTTRDVVFSLDGQRMFISVGSGSNVAEGMVTKSPAEIRDWEASHARGSAWGNEADRANVLVADPEGRGLHIFATGIRNAVGLAVQPVTGELWCSTNERDDLGDDLVPDYITRVHEHGYYGWPWYYLGNHEEPRHARERPDLAGEVTAPDVPVQSHSASLEMTFYPANVSGPSAFPAEYRGEIFAAFHGSWNRTGRTGSKVIRVLLKNGVATGEYEDFMTGFVIDDGHVWGRPVGVTVAHDGALLVTDDAGGVVWRVSYIGR
jgi:glucose/arabinose dehydrogenase